MANDYSTTTKRPKRIPMCLVFAFICPLVIFATLLAVSHTAYAADSTSVAETTFFGNLQDDGQGCTVYSVLNLVIDIFSIGVGILGVVGTMVAGIQYLTARDNEERATKSKRRLLEIVIGLALFAILYALVQWLLPGGKLNGNKPCETISNEQLENMRKEEAAKREEEANKENEKHKNKSKSKSDDPSDDPSSDPGSNPSSNPSNNTNDSVIIILGASQITRVAANVSSYKGSSGKTYSTKNGTLNLIYKGGTGFGFQSTTGWSKAKEIMSKYDSKKQSTTFYVFFTLVGNDIKTYTCNSINNTNQELASQIATYSNLVQEQTNAGYNIKAFVTSAHPLQPGNSNKSAYVVSNGNANKCKKSYRSNYKYKLYNAVMHSFVNSHPNLTYLNTFDDIMSSNFQFKKGWLDYSTTDGIHWTKSTTTKYFKAWMKKASGL